MLIGSFWAILKNILAILLIAAVIAVALGGIAFCLYKFIRSRKTVSGVRILMNIGIY